MTQQPLEKPYLLFVEGKDDKAVVELLLQHLGIESVEVYNVEGKNNFRKRISAVSVQANFNEIVQRVGIVRDADEDPDAARRSCADILRSISRPTDFCIVPSEGPGMLEDLFLSAIENRPERQCIEDFVQCVDSTAVKISSPSKFRMRTFLMLHDPDTMQSLNWVIQENLANPTHPAFAPLRQVLTNFTSS